MLPSLKEWDICNFSCATYFFSFDFFPSLLLHPPASIFYSLSSLCSFLYVVHSLPSFFTIPVASSVLRFLSGSLLEELGRRATWRALSCESARVERNERTDSLCFRQRRREARSCSQVLDVIFLSLFSLYPIFLHSRLLNRLQYMEAITVQHPGCRGEIQEDSRVWGCMWGWVVGNEVRVPSSQRLAVVRRAGKHTSCFWLPGLKAAVTLVEEERVVLGVGWGEQKKQGNKMDEKPKGITR